jgi:hypothetical protein
MGIKGPAGVACATLLLVSVLLGTAVATTAISIEEIMEVVDMVITDDSVQVSTSTTALPGTPTDSQTSSFGFYGWGPPFPWWPARFCAWDYWTSAAWQITLVGKSARCNDTTGTEGTGRACQQDVSKEPWDPGAVKWRYMGACDHHTRFVCTKQERPDFVHRAHGSTKACCGASQDHLS